MELILKNKIVSIVVSAIFVVATIAIVSFAFAYTTGNIMPSSDGAYLQWTPSTSTIHYTLVDEYTCNGLTDYVYTTTTSYRDSYGASLATIPNGSVITDISITPCASANSAGTSTMNVFYRFDGIDSAVIGSYALSGTTPTSLASSTFSGLSIVKGSTSALQIGAVLSDGSAGARLSKMAVVITATLLNSPTNLDATNASSTQNNLTWTDNSSIEDGFEIQRSLNSLYGPFTQVATTTADITSFEDTGLTADQTYYYRVRAFNAGGNSGFSNTDYAITEYTAPSAPDELVSSVTASSTIMLDWKDNSNNETGFSIERSLDDKDYSEITTRPMDATSYEDTDVSASTTYYYKVRAYNNIGYSSYSNTTSSTIP